MENNSEGKKGQSFRNGRTCAGVTERGKPPMWKVTGGESSKPFHVGAFKGAKRRGAFQVRKRDEREQGPEQRRTILIEPPQNR